ncbi:MAG: hypothetical protein AB1690_02570 [Candidatus Zixiibacteriota bacterium]
MPKKSLPLSDTEVSVNKSIAEIIDMLESAGFDQIGQIRNQGKNMILAGYKGAPFRWVIDPQKIVNSLLNSYSDITHRRMRYDSAFHKQVTANIQAKAERVGWRIMADYVKATCISILYDVNTPADVFAGFLVDKSGETIGQKIGLAVESGQIQKDSNLNEILKLTASVGEVKA